ncbi:alcohol dehydrogenase [Xylariales sp. PMI_506]|nr:alcohol dehydrogenase [Xylariales sp. PMI_506]
MSSSNGAKKTMKSVVWEGKPFHMSVKDVPRASIVDETDAVVRLTTAAICGTDLHTFHGVWGSPKAPWPMGHEGVGVVVEVGSAVSNLKVGDRVIVPDATNVGHFVSDPSAGVEFDAFGLGSLFGNLGGLQAEYARVPFADESLTIIPNNPDNDLEYVLLSDIFCTAWAGLSLSGFAPGDSVAVFGAGPVGLLCAYSAILRGASKVFSVDHVQSRLDKAASIGAIPINFTKKGEDASSQIIAQQAGGVNRVVDCCGFECVNAELKPQENYILLEALKVAAEFGGISLIGVYDVVAKSSGAPRANTIPATVEFPISQLWIKGLSLKGSVISATDYIPEILPLIESGRAKPSFVFSTEIGIEAAQKGYERFSKHLETKVAIRFPWEKQEKKTKKRRAEETSIAR